MSFKPPHEQRSHVRTIEVLTPREVFVDIDLSYDRKSSSESIDLGGQVKLWSSQ